VPNFGNAFFNQNSRGKKIMKFKLINLGVMHVPNCIGRILTHFGIKNIHEF
jgi:hypothetical protein